MNEFAGAIDAEGIRIGTPESERYLSGKREPWQMQLPTTYDRRAVLDIHEKYCQALEKSRALSMDQMIADLNRYLATHEWRQLRERRGFDLIFVDEFHYFNAAERMVFHNLFRPHAHASGRLPLYMAYDLKQSPGDASLSSGRTDVASNVFRSVRAGQTELVELKDIFRYTPEIAEFLKDLDGSFPALDLGSDWDHFSAKSQVPPGDAPRLLRFTNDLDLIDDVFQRAMRAANRMGGRRVAILCMNDELFSKYLKYGRISGKYLPLTGRDQVAELRYAGRRPLFSMPEYVAGLQFEEVILIHVDRGELASGGDTIGARRRFISRCYLGASRASTRLLIATSLERGGEADALAGPLKSGSLVPEVG
jgi:hypothetical protein